MELSFELVQNSTLDWVITILRYNKLSKFLPKTMAKPDIHPKWYPEAKVYCNGEVVMTVGSTKPELHVDVWSGNHPFYTGTQKMIDTEGRVERFMRKYGMMEAEATQEEDKK
jgi:large subunit ribosomal protein L31